MSGNKNTLGRLLSKRNDMVSLVRKCSGNPCFGRVFDALVQHGNYQSNYISTTGSGDQDRRQRICTFDLFCFNDCTHTLSTNYFIYIKQYYYYQQTIYNMYTYSWVSGDEGGACGVGE